MPHTSFTSVLALAIYDKILANKVDLGLKDVLFGEQTMIPSTPTAVVYPGPKHRDLAGVSAPGGRTHNMMTVYVELFGSAVGPEAIERLALDQVAEAVETVLHADVTMGGIIIHGFVNDWTPSNARIASSQFRLLRMTYIGRSKTYLSA
jgi:hypothetical protein